MAATTPLADIGWKAVDFSLLGVDGKRYSLADVRGERGTLVMFICNHCPYVKAVMDRIIRDASELERHGIRTVAINSNDPTTYPEDSYENMVEVAQRLALPFPYLFDETQAVAEAYDAVCTPDFFGFNAQMELQYRGRLDASRKEPAPDDAPRELFDAMRLIAYCGEGPGEQYPSMGCAIKWREREALAVSA
ncbi:MAG: thioredoxin family protein [Aquabacterium sp.]|jgi:peroxiredoxin|nr:MAG: thioredoxin family protein [Aquabacterium sp.]